MQRFFFFVVFISFLWMSTPSLNQARAQEPFDLLLVQEQLIAIHETFDELKIKIVFFIISQLNIQVSALSNQINSLIATLSQPANLANLPRSNDELRSILQTPPPTSTPPPDFSSDISGTIISGIEEAGNSSPANDSIPPNISTLNGPNPIVADILGPSFSDSPVTILNDLGIDILNAAPSGESTIGSGFFTEEALETLSSTPVVTEASFEGVEVIAEQTSATVFWTTEELTIGVVSVFSEEIYNSSESEERLGSVSGVINDFETTPALNHSVHIEGLEPQTLYYFFIETITSSGAMVKNVTQTFQTLQ